MEKTNGLINKKKKQLTKNKCYRYEPTTTTDRMTIDLGQAHNECVLVKHVCERLTLSKTWTVV